MNRGVDQERPGPYRSRRGIVLGVCRGMADYFDVSPFWVRLGVLFLCLFSGFWPVLILYFVAGLLMKKEPVVRYASESDREFYESYADSRTRALHRLQTIHERLNRRIQRMESMVTGREYDWDQRMKGS